MLSLTISCFLAMLVVNSSAAPLSQDTVEPLLEISAQVDLLGIKARRHAPGSSSHGSASLIDLQLAAQAHVPRYRSSSRRFKRSLRRRDENQDGTPGFVEVATPLFSSNLLKSVAGLSFSVPSGGRMDTLKIGTSATQSSEFYVTKSSVNATDDTHIVQLQVPIFDSAELATRTYCATFPTLPPCQLSLEPCGPSDGKSQDFAYNATSGQLQPLFATAAATGVDKLIISPLAHDLLIAQFDEVLSPTQSAASSLPSASGNTASSEMSQGLVTVMPSRVEMLASASSSLSGSVAVASASATPRPAASDKLALFFVPRKALMGDATSSAQSSSSVVASSSASASDASLTPSAALFAVKANSVLIPSAVSSASQSLSSVWPTPTAAAFAADLEDADEDFAAPETAFMDGSSTAAADSACVTQITCPAAML